MWAALVLACAGAEPPPPEPMDSVDGNARLSQAVVPVRYALDLRIEPERGLVAGNVRIDIDVHESVRALHLHAEDLELDRVQIETGGETRDVRWSPGRNGGLALFPRPPLEAGPATLHIDWEARLGESPRGLYRVEDGDNWYAFTQFQPLSARKAFPCFDEPGFKTPYSVTLRVPAGQYALANAPERERRRDGAFHVYTFDETAPLPTYLVAFAVGAFDVVDGPADFVPPLRVIAPRGRGDRAAFALEKTVALLRWLEAYFGRPYPFAKLDQIAVPNFEAGAMENVGLVTYRESRLLLDPETAPIHDLLSAEVTIAHELAHMWFGNLVTPAWWDDLWLNESFASWMAAKAVDAVDPELEAGLGSVLGAQWVMGVDAKVDARAVRQPIRDGGDAYNAFDGVTYTKGAAVLRMLEAWTGEEPFRDAVRSYLAAHAHGVASTEDLLAALDAESGRAVSSVARGFLDRPGVPLLRAELSCPQASVAVEQSRYRTAPSALPEDGAPWQVPVCLRTAAGEACGLIEGERGRVPVPEGACTGEAAWLHPNAGERGYYRWRLPPEGLRALLAPAGPTLSLPERVALPGNLRALLEADAIDVESALDALVPLARDANPRVVSGATGVLWSLDQWAGDDPPSEAFAGWVRTVLGPQLARVGVDAVPGESAADQLVRASVVPALAELGRDPDLAARAGAVAERYLTGEPVPEQTLSLLLSVAARDGDQKLWERLVKALPAAESPAERKALVRALGSFEDGWTVARSLGLVLDGRLREQDYRTLAWSVRRTALPQAWLWLTRNYEQLGAELGPMTAASLPWLASGFCHAERREEVRAFFAAAADPPAGTRRNAALVVESIEQCANMRARVRPPLEALLAKAAPS